MARSTNARSTRVSNASLPADTVVSRSGVFFRTAITYQCNTAQSTLLITHITQELIPILGWTNNHLGTFGPFCIIPRTTERTGNPVTLFLWATKEFANFYLAFGFNLVIATYSVLNLDQNVATRLIKAGDRQIDPGWSYRQILVTNGVRRQRFEFAI